MNSLPLVYASGWAHHRNSMAELARLVAGNGNSVCCGFDTPSDPAEIVLDEIRKFSSPAVAVGWSMGGMAMLQAVIEQPSFFKALVMINSTPSFCARRGYPHGVEPRILRAMKRRLGQDRTGTLRDFARMLYSSEFVMPQCTFDGAALEAGLNYLEHTDLRGSLDAVELPVLVLHAAGDEVVPFEAGRFLHQNLRNSRLVRLEGAMHGAPVEAPRLMSGLIIDFLEQLEAHETR